MDLRKLFIASVAVAAIATGAWLSYEIASPPPEPRVATVLPGPVALPAFSLVDQRGNAFTRDSFEGQWDLVFFGFTHCPDVCPLTLQTLASALQQLRANDAGKQPRIVLISVDPERDTVDALRDYVAHFDDEAIGVTGEVEELKKLTNALGIFFQKSAVDGENYSVDHSAVVLMISPQAEFVALFGAPHEIESFVHDIPLVLARQ